MTKALILHWAAHLHLPGMVGRAATNSCSFQLTHCCVMHGHKDVASGHICVSSNRCMQKSGLTVIEHFLPPLVKQEDEWSRERSTRDRFTFCMSCQLYSFMSTKLTFGRRNNSMNCE